MLPKEILTEAREVIGSKLREIREKQNLTMEQLAERVGCSTGTISRIESGRFFPAMDQLLTILHELDFHFIFAENEADLSTVEQMLKILK